MFNVYVESHVSCADPENFVIGGPILIAFSFFFFFLVDEGGRIQKPL